MSARPIEHVAILSFHSHGDRSFLDDRDLALISGDLADAGIENDLVVVAFGAGAERDAEAEARLVAELEGYDCIVFERVWSTELVARLRAALPDRTFVHVRGEHELPDPPADYVCKHAPRYSLPLLVRFLRGAESSAPVGTLGRTATGWEAIGAPSLAKRRELRFAPNLRPKIINPGELPSARTFSIQGNGGCPYQADARENPIYAGITMPEGVGRGCAFCTTGNRYEGRPVAETAASVLEQLRYLRRHGPWLDRIVLKDQNPFAYLTEVVRAVADEGLGPFTLMLETRADWLTRNARRFDQALEAAKGAAIRIAPFLVGIESFSQPELDRYNKGTTAEANIEFIERLWSFRERYGATLDLDSASFGFVLLSPWTTIADLETNLAAIRRTRFDRLRGRILLSRARLYPDTALYYLAERDGLFEEAHRPGEDSSRRYGYFPARPWRYLHPETAHFASLAMQLVEATRGRDEIATFAALLDAFREADDWREIDAAQVLARLRRADRPVEAEAPRQAPAELRQRFARLASPLALDVGFAGGWTVKTLSSAPGALRVQLAHERESDVVLEIVPRGGAPGYTRSRSYDIRYLNASLTPPQQQALDELCRAIAANDR